MATKGSLMKISVMGTGYVGLVSGVCLADVGHEVTCIDNNADKITLLNNGSIPIYEPGLNELVEKNVNKNRLHFTSNTDSISEADVVFIAVGTPSADDGCADLQYVMACAEEIAKKIKKFTVVVNKSTVPVGTGKAVEALIAGITSPDLFEVVSNPEFLREGAAINDFLHPDRIVVGVEGEAARAVMAEVYSSFSDNGVPILYTERQSSELIKYASNAFLATKISFINEIADLCEKVGADVDDVAKGMGSDTRIGEKFLQAGPGYGGSCFPKDTLALLNDAHIAGSQLQVVEATVKANNDRKVSMAAKIINACNNDVNGKKLAIWGLTFKPGTDDMRDSPSLTIIPILQKAGAIISSYDPEGMTEAKKHFNNIDLKTSAEGAIKGADALVILTEWDEFKQFDVNKIAKELSTPTLVDLRNCIDRDAAKRNGLNITQIGRKISN